MENLVLRYTSGDDETCSCTSLFPFPYASKDEFVFDILERYKDRQWTYYTVHKSKSKTDKVELFDDIWLCEAEILDIEKMVYTLDEWFRVNTEGYEIEHKWKIDH